MHTAARTYQSVSDKARRDDIVVANLEFVRHVLGKLVARLPARVDKENLESAGVLGLVEAAHKYDHRRGIPFQTFAYPRIRGAILDELRKNSVLPQRVLRLIKVVRLALETLPGPVTPEAIAAQANITIDEVDEALQAIELSREESWDEQVLDLVRPRDGNDNPSARLQIAEQREMMADGIERLPDQERKVLTLYYVEDLRLREIGEVIGLSESRASRLLARAQMRLKEYIRSRGG